MTPPLVVLVLASVGGYMQETAELEWSWLRLVGLSQTPRSGFFFKELMIMNLMMMNYSCEPPPC